MEVQTEFMIGLDEWVSIDDPRAKAWRQLHVDYIQMTVDLGNKDAEKAARSEFDRQWIVLTRPKYSMSTEEFVASCQHYFQS